MKALLLIFGVLTTTISCQKNEEIIVEQNRYEVPSVAEARHYFNENSSLRQLNPNQFFRNSDDGINADWDRSKSRKYKDEPQESVDILYTPIYLPTSGLAKSFIGSIEINGEMQSKIIVLIYTESPNETIFSGYMLIYDLDGFIDYAYKYEEGQRVAEGLPNLTNSSLNRNTNSNDCESAFDNLGCFMDWLGTDWFGVAGYIENDTIEIIASGDSSTGSFSDGDWAEQGFSIPALGDDTSGPNSNLPIPWWPGNKVTAHPLSLVMALELENINVPEVEWLLNEASQEQLQHIADFLNDNRVKDNDTTPDEITDDGIDQNQMTEISQAALDLALDMINYMLENPGVSFEYDQSNQIDNNSISFDSFNDFEDFFYNTNYTSNSSLSTEIDEFGHSYNMSIFSFKIKMFIEKEIPEGNSCDCIEIIDAFSYIEGNETLASYNEIEDFWTEISSQQNTIRVNLRGKIKYGLNIDGFPWRRSEVHVFYVVYDHSTGTILEYGDDLE